MFYFSALIQCNICKYQFGCTLPSGERLPATCNTCKEEQAQREEFKRKEKLLLSNITAAYISPFE